MEIWSLLFIAFIVQEPVSSDAILLEAYQHHYGVWVIHLLFVIATLIDVTVGYYLGMLVKRTAAKSNYRFALYLRKKSDEFSKKMSGHGKKLSLFLYGPIIFPLSAVIAPWLDISFWDAAVFLFIGDLIFWYGSEWLVVLGVKTFIPNPIIALYSVCAVCVLLFLAIRYVSKKISGRKISAEKNSE